MACGQAARHTVASSERLTNRLVSPGVQTIHDGTGTHPFLRWAGSKRQILPELLAHIPSDCGRYVEPFAGSACLFFALSPKSAILADINEELISTYRAVKHNVSEVADALRHLPIGKECYYAIRGQSAVTRVSALRAAHFIYLNRFCFNGLYRTNGSGQYNVPYGGNKSGRLPSEEALSKCSSQLLSAELIAGPFQETLQRAKRGDFVYMDPPFCVTGRRVFREYSPTHFDWQQVQELREWMERLDHVGIAFLVSYAECDEGTFLSKGFHSRCVGVRRSIAGFTKSRIAGREMLIFNRLS
jgi:DNA adenine methylase